jgi:hypothetical protein
MPLPDTFTDSVSPISLSMRSWPFLVPKAVGVNRNEILHVLKAGKLPTQVLVTILNSKLSENDVLEIGIAKGTGL